MAQMSMANHCTRTDIRIALSSSTRSMLDQQTRSRSFTSGMPVAEIEDTFLRRWKKVAGHEARISYETPIQDPKELKSYDLILWGAGRRSLDEALRKELGCEVKIGDSQKVIVFQVLELPGDAWQLGSLDLSGATVSQGGRPLRVMLRPGFEGACACWLWVFGLPADLLSSLTPKQASTVPRDSLIEAFEDLVGDSGMALRPSLE
ncbi:Protein kinase 2A, partial [Durusdinium trenchii]